MIRRASPGGLVSATAIPVAAGSSRPARIFAPPVHSPHCRRGDCDRMPDHGAASAFTQTVAATTSTPTHTAAAGVAMAAASAKTETPAEHAI